MVLTPSQMIPLGTQAPDFHLIDSASGKMVSLSELKSSAATVIMFICNHCPYVIHIQTKLAEIAHSYIQKGVAFIAINSNDVEMYPEDHPDKMREISKEKGYPFPYLFDETQEVAKAYHAVCTFFIFDKDFT